MLKFCLIFGFTVFLIGVVSSEPAGKPRTLFPLLNSLLKYGGCGMRDCPRWKCQDDSAVIHGYCCKCPGWQYDYVPVFCSPDLKCPISPEPLCSDYNFMMDCCCTGP